MDNDIRAYWKEAERCWRAVAQHVEARTWPFVSKEPEKSEIEGQGTLSLRQSDHVAVPE